MLSKVKLGRSALKLCLRGLAEPSETLTWMGPLSSLVAVGSFFATS